MKYNVEVIVVMYNFIRRRDLQVTCKNCGAENEDDQNYCKSCGQPLRTDSADKNEPGSPPQYQQQTTYTNQPQSDNGNNGYAVASMVLGIVSIVTCCVPIVGVVCGVVAVVFSRKMNRVGLVNSYTRAGFVCGLLGIGLSVLAFVYSVIVSVLKLSLPAIFN